MWSIDDFLFLLLVSTMHGQLLGEKGIENELNVKDALGKTPLMYAAQVGSLEVS